MRSDCFDNGYDSEYSLLVEYLQRVDSTFPDSLSNRTSLQNYACKLLDKANIFSVKVDNTIVGLVAGYIDNRIGQQSFISVVSVLPDYQGMGLSKVLLNCYLKYADRQDVSEVFLYVYKSNYRAINLYEGLGFVMCETTDRPDYLKYIKRLR